MAVQNKLMKVGTGTLKIGGSSGLDASAECLKCEISASPNKGTQRLLLNGDTLQGETTYTWTLKATVIQNLTAKGFVGYLHANKGKVKELEFIPNTGDGAKFKGNVRCDPPTVGGEVGTTPDSDVSLEFIGEPAFTAATKAGGQTV